ncbi:uncharacterized protein M421DRAFT_90111 [Didymella exigua CBS 183.55]|uniref:Uncharacterized protein n=1 Tax=Didymella exigua CBS 183.55 TaxID=1150837 RepID=A0A6A5RY04_9PLEO|nr:uncharacterized protein M421DRAFT_90111 [Didymella exigua CBS 183.55]KAF1931908.1 hypothetical protein M421DRAFT_90111 [Didymella exigua CBS 183.55]
MDSERPHLSITLPRNFMFHYRDGAAPQTPEPEPQVAELQPPPPPRQTLKVRRRRATLVRQQIELDFAMEEKPIPTIEATNCFEASNALPSPPSGLDNAYLSPPTSFSRLVSPPKTPAHQVRTIDIFAGPQHWDDLESTRSETSSRPTSSSGFSDSSISSRGSMESLVSRGGSCTSPEEEMCDPFSFDALEMKYKQPSSPLAAQQHLRTSNKLKLKATFTEEMDYHLWRTYMTYLQDPTVTPFKAVPLTTPPNGVCHRVARMARKTWKGPVPSRIAEVRAASQFVSRNGTPETIKALKSGNGTPIARPSGSYLRYPTEKQCRKRLRDLTKQRPNLSAYYQRLLHRSPSPLQSSPPSEKAEQPAQPQPQPQPQLLPSPFTQDKSLFTFSTRDMNVSLATSTAASMQMGNPLSQLTADLTPRPEQKSWSRARSSAHQKSQSLHVGLGLGLSNVLGSPFQSSTVEMTDAAPCANNAQTWHAQIGLPTPRLGSPFQLHAPRPKSRVFKRRALANSFEDKTRNRGNSFVDDIFGAPAESSHRRVRSRGFSLGDMMDGAGARRLPLSSSGPTEFNSFANIRPQLPSPVHTSPAIMTAEALGQGTIRLGTPFGGRPSNTFPRASTSYGFEPPASFEQRFAAATSNSER